MKDEEGSLLIIPIRFPQNPLGVRREAGYEEGVNGVVGCRISGGRSCGILGC